MIFIFPKKLKTIITVVIALFFIYTSLVKILSLSQFVVNVQQYNILPDSAVLLFSLLIVLIELIAGIGLVLNVHTKVFSIVLITLLSIFTGAIVINLFQGNVVDCGCFGSTVSNEISWWGVLRNVILGLIIYRLILRSKKI